MNAPHGYQHGGWYSDPYAGVSPQYNGYQTNDDGTQIERRKATRWWRQFQTLQLLFCCILATGGAVGHHFLYAYLDGKKAENQQWVVRGGTALAFAVKVMFSASISVGYTQCVWRKLRTRAYSLNAVDALFTLRDNPLGFFGIEILWHASGPAMMAALSWSLALLPILVPASISIRVASTTQSIESLSLYTLNFTKDLEETQFRSGTPISPIQLAQVPGMGAAWKDYQTSTPAAVGHIYNTLYSKGIANIQSPCGANCSFEQRFYGPAYKCSDIDFANIKTKDGEDTAQNPFCAWLMVGDFGPCGAVFVNAMSRKSLNGITWYMASNSSTAGGTQPIKPWQDGKIWVAHQYMLPEYRQLVDDVGAAKDAATEILPDMFERHMFVCESYNATFNLQRSYRNFQHTVAGNIEYLNPTNFTDFHDPGNMETRNYAAYSIHETLYSLLSGDIGPNGRDSPTDNTHMGMSALVEEMPFPRLSSSVYHGNSAQKPVRDLRPLFEQLHFNITVGLLGLGPSLLYAENGTSVGPAEVTSVEYVWVYDPVVLLAVYGIAALGDVLVIIVGVVAMTKQNRGVFGFEFARVLAATKASPELVDSVAGEWKDLLDPMPRETGKKRIRWHDGLVGGNGGGFDSNDVVFRRQAVGFKLDGEN